MHSTLRGADYILKYGGAHSIFRTKMPRNEGPLASLFGNPQGRAIARILDQSVIVGNMEQTISMLADSTRLDYKTVQESLRQLERRRLVKKSRKIGNAQT